MEEIDFTPVQNNSTLSQNDLTPIQAEILKALEQHSEKALCTEAIIAKKIRDNVKIDGKQKAGLSMFDVEKAVAVLEGRNVFYSVHLNSANDILIKKDSETKYLDQDARHRRLACEKSMSILSSGDLKSGKNKKAKPKSHRTETKKLNINNYDFD